MASLPMAFGATTTIATKRRVFAATATKSTAGPPEEKSILDFILGALTKEDQLLETDPLLKKTGDEEKTVAPTNGRGKSGTVAVPAKKKNGGFGLGGLFAKN